MKLHLISISAAAAVTIALLLSAPAARPQKTYADKSTSGCWPWPDSLDAVIADPENHTVLYEDSNVQLLDVHTMPGTTNSKHDHRWSSVFINIEPQPKGIDHRADGSNQVGGVINSDAPFPVLVAVGPQGPHAYQNVGTFRKHFYRLQFKKLPFVCPEESNVQFQDAGRASVVTSLPPVEIPNWSWSASMDQVAASPNTDKVLLDIDDFRLVEVTIPPGTKQNMGTQKLPSTLFFFETQPKGTEAYSDAVGEGVIGAHTRITRVDRRFENAVFPTAIRMGPQPPHSFENTDTIPAHFYRMEFKKFQYKG